MKIERAGFRKSAVALVGALALASAGAALAAPYSIILKDAAGVPQTCAGGGFQFTKTVDGSFPVTAPSVVLASPCFGLVGQLAFNQNPSVNAQVVTTTADRPGTGGAIETLNNGPNVEGITGSLQNVTGQYRIEFAFAGTAVPFTRTYSIIRISDGATVVSGNYYVRNDLRTVPEPNTAALAAGALALMLLAARRRIRRAVRA